MMALSENLKGVPRPAILAFDTKAASPCNWIYWKAVLSNVTGAYCVYI